MTLSQVVDLDQCASENGVIYLIMCYVCDEVAMVRLPSFVRVAIFSCLFPFMSASAADVISIEPQRTIEDRICAGGQEMCATVCAGMNDQTECLKVCTRIQNSACHLPEQKAVPGKEEKAVKGAICTAVYDTICEWISCSGTGFDQTQCREKCHEYLTEIKCP